MIALQFHIFSHQHMIYAMIYFIFLVAKLVLIYNGTKLLYSTLPYWYRLYIAYSTDRRVYPKAPIPKSTYTEKRLYPKALHT
jgi:hypothetical protein